MPKPAAFAVAIAAGILGPSSLLIFAVFLWTGSFGIFDLGAGGFATLVWDATLCFVFFLQHSGMIRRSFRNRLRRWLPDCYGGVVYTIASSAALLLLVGGWQRSSIEIYAVRGGGRWLLAFILLPSLAGVLWGIRSLNNFDAFGIRQFLSGVRGSVAPQSVLTIEGPYRVVRHPFYAFGIVALWAAPVLSLDRVVLNALFTLWIVIGATLEERDLASDFGEAYRNYQRSVPMFVPGIRARRPIAPVGD